MPCETSNIPRKRTSVSTMTDPKILVPAIGDRVQEARPPAHGQNPVMFVVEIVATLTTVLFVRDLFTGGGISASRFQIILWLWFTVLFANFAEAVAEGRGKAQAASLRKTKTELWRRSSPTGQLKPVRKAPASRAHARRSRPGRGGRTDPVGRRRGGRRGLRRRIRHHRRMRARDPRIRRRPFGGDGRHARALRLHRGADHRDARARPSSTA